MIAEITYIAVYLLGLFVGMIFAIIATRLEYEDFPWLQEREYTYKDDRENLSKQHTVTGLSSNLNFGILKK